MTGGRLDASSAVRRRIGDERRDDEMQERHLYGEMPQPPPLPPEVAPETAPPDHAAMLRSRLVLIRDKLIAALATGKLQLGAGNISLLAGIGQALEAVDAAQRERS